MKSMSLNIAFHVMGTQQTIICYDMTSKRLDYAAYDNQDSRHSEEVFSNYTKIDGNIDIVCMSRNDTHDQRGPRGPMCRLD